MEYGTIKPLTGPRADALRFAIEQYMLDATIDLMALMREHGVEDEGEAFGRLLMVFLGTVIGGLQRGMPDATVEDLIVQIRYQWIECARAEALGKSS